MVRGYSSAGGVKKGQFSITIQRLTATLSTLDLPVALFGTSAYQAGYQSIIQAPATTALVITGGKENATNYGFVDFAYTVGGDTDIIRVKSSTLQYPELLNALNTDLLSYNSIKMTLAGNADVSQFNRSLFFKTNNIFGAKDSQNVDPASFIETSQLQSNLVELLIGGNLDKESAITFDLAPDAGLQITMTFFFDRFVNYQAEAVLGN
jgi:hypothetical protein